MPPSKEGRGKNLRAAPSYPRLVRHGSIEEHLTDGVSVVHATPVQLIAPLMTLGGC